MEPKLIKVLIKKEPDEFVDYSHLGRFSDTWEEHAIDRQETGHYESHQYRYFIPEGDNEKERAANYELIESLDQTWTYIGIWCEGIVEAETNIAKNNEPITMTHRFKSEGLWGIEEFFIGHQYYESSKNYINEVIDDQLEELKQQLEKYNIDLSDWNRLVDEARREYD